MDEAAIHITWALFSIIAVIFITIAWTVIAKTPSRKNGIHAFVASLLTSRAIYCLSVTLLLVAYYFAAVNWSILACHALYWLWTVSWSSDLLAAVAAMGWGLRKIQYPTSAFRLGSTVAIAGMWLIATTIAGIMTYFNQGIKSNDYLSNVGCSVVPNPEELSLAITLFVFQWTGVALTVSMLLSFIIKFQISAKTHNKESEKTKTCSLVAKGLGATNGEECLHSVPITKEPGRLEAIEDRQKRRKLTGGGTVHLSELDLEQLTSWRIVYCIIECLLLLLNLTPHMVFLGMNIFTNGGNYNFTVALMVVVSCHLVYSLLLPFLLIVMSPEYRLTLFTLINHKHRRGISQEPELPSFDSGTIQSTQSHTQSVLKSQTPASNIQLNPPSPPPRPASAVLRVTPRRHSLASRRLSAPAVRRTESGFSRLEWKEQMMEKFKIPVGPVQGKEEEVNDRALSRLASVSVKESDDTDTDTGFDYSDSDIERALKTQVRGIDNDGYQGDECELAEQENQSVHNVQVQQDPATTDQMTYKSEAVCILHEPFDRKEVVYSPTNPFLPDLPAPTCENESVSDRSVEAEIVTITIKGKGSLKRKLRDQGLWPDHAYIRDEDNTFVNSQKVKQKSIHGDRYRTYGHQTSSPGFYRNQYDTPNLSKTNPFLNDIDYSHTEQDVENDENFADIRSWLESMDEHVPFPNYGSDSYVKSDVDRRKACSNPFLQDISEWDERTPEFYSQTPSAYNEVFTTMSAPTSPDVKKFLSTSQAKVAVTFADFLQSQSERSTLYVTRGRRGFGRQVTGRRRRGVFHDTDHERPHSSCSYVMSRDNKHGWKDGNRSQTGSKYITEYI